MKKNIFHILSKLLVAVFLAIGLLTTSSSLTLATYESGNLIKSQKNEVYINFFSNSDRYKRNKPLQYTHIVEGLAIAKKRLVDANKIQNIPIFISIPSEVFEIYPTKTQISLQNKCVIDESQMNIGIGQCYKIHYIGEDSYENFLKLVATLPTIQSGDKPKVINNIASFTTKPLDDTKMLASIDRFFNPVWSPDSRYVVYTYWDDGEISYSVDNVVNNNTSYVKFQSLIDNPMNSPLWSGDSKYLFVASLDGIVIYNVEPYQEQKVVLPDISNLETLFFHDEKRNKLMIARDTSIFSNYEIYEYDLSSQELNKIESGTTRPDWERKFDKDDYLKTGEITSPDQKWKAVLTPDGRMFHVKQAFSGQKVETNNVTEASKSAKVYSALKSSITIKLAIIIILILSLAIFVLLFKNRALKTKYYDKDSELEKKNLKL